ncbi:hypothetical protein Mapa_005915 [Marchantia paleacea]|nr:hypothetical protein Mapa_005915 [Marchantia paleacea]
MDMEVQGVLVAAKKEWPHIHISDSLVMTKQAVKIAEVECKAVAVLGVDFMSENVCAILDKNVQTNVSVYCMSNDEIGCSMTEAAKNAEYVEYLKATSIMPKSFHLYQHLLRNQGSSTDFSSHHYLHFVECSTDDSSSFCSSAKFNTLAWS